MNHFLTVFLLLLFVILSILVIRRATTKHHEQTEDYTIRSFLKDNLAKEWSAYADQVVRDSFNPVFFQSFDQAGDGLSLQSWKQLTAQLPDLSAYFSVIWIPPPQESTGKPGYNPVSYSLDSYWGTEDDLRQLSYRARQQGVTLMADIVLHHLASANEQDWWKAKIVSYKSPVQYLDVWMQDNYNTGESLAKHVVDNQPECLTKTTSSNCVRNPTTCGTMRPLYTFDRTKSDGGEFGTLQALNLCNLDVLRAQIAYLHKLYSIGIHAYRYDQANGFVPEMIQLYNNSDITRTRALLNNIATYCKSVEYVKCSSLYTLSQEIQQIPDSQLDKYTGPPHSFAVAEAFTYAIEENTTYDYPRHRWWALHPELTKFNAGLRPQDKIGVYDMGLMHLLCKTLASPCNSDEGMVYTPPVTLNSAEWAKFHENTMIGKYPEYTQQNNCLLYTLVTNHDNDGIMNLYGNSLEYRGYTGEGYVPYNRLLVAYFILMLLPGFPFVFSLHYYFFKHYIKAFILLRYLLGIQYYSKVHVPAQVDDVLSWYITGNKSYYVAIVDTSVVPNFQAPMDFKTVVFEYKLNLRPTFIPVKLCVWSK